MEVLVVGDLIADVVMRLEFLPTPESVQMARDLKVLAGGAANFAITASRLGLKVGILDAVGVDAIGKSLIQVLAFESVDVSLIKIKNGFTKQTLVLVSERGEKSFVGLLTESTATISPDDVVEEFIRDTQCVYVSGYSVGLEVLFPSEGRAVLKSVDLARQLGKIVFFDPGPLAASMDRRVLQGIIEKTNILSLNLSEASSISGTSNPEKAAEALRGIGPEIVSVKMGENGCLLLMGGALYREPGLKVPVVDPTGAGDAFNAALLFGFLRGWHPQQIVRLANSVGALSVTRLGAGQNLPEKREIIDFLIRVGEYEIVKKLEV
ncbi:MAG: carbohydrate kinase family protein [Ignisphaera sp.]|nr:carbohydrate kinase family protein [Ignisphaera sp.]MDW8085592.1 carbohydrate kinase family protein [Ignisphaera sp.]